MARKKITKHIPEEAVTNTASEVVSNDPLLEITDVIVGAMQDKKAKDIVGLDLRKLNNRMVDKFIICHAENSRQVDAIASEVEEQVRKKLNDKPWHREGFENKEWILLDYINIIVHVFLKEKREFYAIEELWGDAEQQQYEEFA